MRAVSLVRYWLYGFRGFVVMTVSLALAFSWAVTGPPTNTEIDVVTDAVGARVAAFGEEIEAAAIEVCPSLPEEVQMLCAGAPPQEVTPQPVEAPPKPPPPVELAINVAAESPTPNVTEADLLGAPTPRAERPRASRRAAPERAAQTRRTASQRVTQARRTAPERVTQARRAAPRAQPPRQATAQRTTPPQQPQVARRQAHAPAPPVAREAERVPAIARADEAARVQAEMERAADDYRREADERSYRERQEAEYQAWLQERRERRERREERRRRREERERAYEEGYYEYEEAYPLEVW